MVPEESAITSCGWLPLPSENSVNCPSADPELGVVVGVAEFVETLTVVDTAVIDDDGGLDGEVLGEDETTFPPPDGSTEATFPFPAFEDCSAIQGCWVVGFMLMILGSAPTVGICHSLIVLSPRRTPT